jgi:threonine-phosphate decarboxylase
LETLVMHGGAPAEWLEFSANLNPMGTPTAVVDAIAAASYGRYADLDPTAAEAHLAADAGVPADCVLLTAGATDAIRLISAAFARGRTAVIVGPTYSEYRRAVQLHGGRVIDVNASPPAFDPPIDAALTQLSTDAQLLFLCDPNNPTGRALRSDDLHCLVGALPTGARLALDQSFAPFALGGASASAYLAAGDVMLVRSLTKVLATPGLRVGYVIARPATIAMLRSAQDPWAVGAHGIAAALTASWSLPSAVRQSVSDWRARLAHALTTFGMRALPSQANFLLVHVGDAAQTLVAALAARRIAVRWCGTFGLPDYVRLAVRPPAEQDLLIEALTSIAHASVD